MNHEASIPVSIDRDGDATIAIRWSDGSQSTWTAAQLRTACPCASCREKRRGEQEQKTTKPTSLPVLSAAEAKPLSIEAMRPVGNYAYSIAFSDGHSSGVFLFEMLRNPPNSL